MFLAKLRDKKTKELSLKEKTIEIIILDRTSR